MKPFQTKPKLFIKKYLCGMYDAFTGVEYSSNDVMSIEMSN